MEQRKPLKRKVREGVVISNKMNKTVTVRIDRRINLPRLKKQVVRGKKYYVHNENPEIIPGTKVRIVETKPLSKMKRWRVLEIL